MVEDNTLNQEVVEQLLTQIGCTVDVVSSGQDVIQAVQDTAYDLVLMDEHMPGMAGTTATQAIRALPYPARDVVIVGSSANVFAHQIRSFEEAGMNGFVAKPLTRAALAQMLLKHGLGEPERAALPTGSEPRGSETRPLAPAGRCDVTRPS